MSSAPTHKRVLQGMLIGGILLAACDTGLIEPAASEITIHSGDSQVVPLGSMLPKPLAVRVTGSDGRPAPGITIRWTVTTGTGDLRSWPVAQPLIASFTITDASGIARVFFRPRVLGTNTVTAEGRGLAGSPATFTTSATAPPDVVIRFGAVFDCYPEPDPNDPSIFAGPGGSSDVTVQVGATVQWEYSEGMHPTCTARVTSTSVPPGGEPFDSGIISPGQRFLFVPRVAGTWKYVDAVNGGSGTLTVTAP